MPKFRFYKLWYLVGLLALASVASGFAAYEARPRNFAKLYFFDVGQGDGIYLRTPEGNDVIVDSGPGDVMLGKLGAAMPFADRTIELAILTHPHADHISGMVEILKRYRVERVMLPEADYDSAAYRELLDLLKEKRVAVIRPRLGQRFFLDSETVLDVDYPALGGAENHPKDINDASIVARLTLGQTHVLLAGDAGKNIEGELVGLGLPLAAEILKVGHHGSRHSTSDGFLAAVAPRYSVISVGAGNTYGHPHEETLAALQKSGTEVLRTDRRGDIILRLYPETVKLDSR